MQTQKNIIRIIAVVTGATALYGLMSYGELILSGDSTLAGFPVWFVTMFVLSWVVIVLKLIAAVALLFLKKWGWQMGVFGLSLDVGVRLIGIVSAWIETSRCPFLGPMITSKSIDGTIIVSSVTMIPTCVITLISLVCVVVLVLKPIKSLFVKIEGASEGGA